MAITEATAPFRMLLAQAGSRRRSSAVAVAEGLKQSHLVDVTSGLARRTAVREFREAAISRRTLALTLRGATTLYRDLLPASVPLSVLVMARSVLGLSSGFYRYVFEEASLTWAGCVPPDAENELRVASWNAPVVLLVGGQYAPCSTEGSNTYFETLVSAAAYLELAWLSAIDQGLAGCPYGGALEVARLAIGRAQQGESFHAFTLALGWPRYGP